MSSAGTSIFPATAYEQSAKREAGNQSFLTHLFSEVWEIAQ
jgi:hypothetical protein